MANEVRLIEFEVVDNQTGRYPNCELIAVTEEWAKHLVYCDIDCFAITEDGNLLLIDDCNNIAYPPSDRFTVKFDPESLRPKGRWVWKHRHRGGFHKYTGKDAFGEIHTIEVDERFEVDEPYCPKCGKWNESVFLNYCPNCGEKMEG